MPGITPTFANDLFKLLFLGTPIANIADNAASSPITSLEFSLHTALPTTGQNHNEVTYTGYARVALSRSGSAFSVTTNLLSWLAEIQFPEATAGLMSATYLGIGTAHTGARKPFCRQDTKRKTGKSFCILVFVQRLVLLSGCLRCLADSRLLLLPMPQSALLQIQRQGMLMRRLACNGR